MKTADRRHRGLTLVEETRRLTDAQNIILMPIKLWSNPWPHPLTWLSNSFPESHQGVGALMTGSPCLAPAVDTKIFLRHNLVSVDCLLWCGSEELCRCDEVKCFLRGKMILNYSGASSVITEDLKRRREDQSRRRQMTKQKWNDKIWGCGGMATSQGTKWCLEAEKVGEILSLGTFRRKQILLTPFFFFFLTWAIFKVYIESVTIFGFLF